MTMRMKQRKTKGSYSGFLAAIACVTLLSNSPLAYADTHNIQAVQQAKVVKGSIVDEVGDPVIGASVLIKGSGKGTATDLEGNFVLNDVPDDATLQVSYVGYRTLTVSVKGKTALSLTLQEDSESLDEVVVVGYGTMKKSDLTGSVGSVSAEKLVARGATSISDALQGSVPGVSITQKNSRAGGGFDIQIRGQASINKQADPLYVIDGVVCSSMDFLNPEDIERIDILKDASSTAIYGSRASAGVIMITTKGSKGADKAQRVSISYDGYYGVRSVARMLDFMNAQEFMDYRLARFTTLDGQTYEGSSRKGVDADGHPHYRITDNDLNTAFIKRTNGTSYRDSKLMDMVLSGSEGYDWKDYVTRTGSQQNHFISANGATDKVNFRLGIGYQGEESVFKHNDYSRYNIKGAFDGKLSKVFEAGLSVNMAYSVREDFCSNSTYSPYQTAFLFNSFVNPYDENGNLYNNPGSTVAFDSSSQFTSTISPLIDLENKNYTDQTRTFRAMGNVYLRANIMDGLKITTTFSVKKFDDSNIAKYEAKTDYRDIHIITLPDIYLYAAEAYLKAGETQKALERLNTVRRRAGLSALTSIDIDAILKERACELFGQGSRWIDLRRTQKLVEYNNLYNPQIKGRAAQCIGQKLLRPIPQGAIDANDQLSVADQNPGY